MKKTDYLIIGAGIAGLTTALHLKDQLGDEVNITIITKGHLKENNSYWAQGGVAAVMTKTDRFVKHIDDTMAAGADHCDRHAVRNLVENAPKAIRYLQSLGVKFNDEPLMEGAHSEPRVWQTSDFTGQDIMNQLIKSVQKIKNIQIIEDLDAVELIVHNEQCKGAFVRPIDKEEVEPFLAKQTILATGGLGQLFDKTSNPRAAGGDGLALAVNAGLDLLDLEFVQFHPTALDREDDGRYFLLSETLRGFGAKVVNSQGNYFLQDYDQRAELAPRDLVTRAIYFEESQGKIYLKLKHLDQKELSNHFPNITKRLKQYGFNVAEDLIPITPVAHFACGGIPTDLHGATKLPGLFAVGEVACTKVHGANRLASNALLEALVFAELVAKAVAKNKAIDDQINLDENIDLELPKVTIEDFAQVKAYAKRISQIMWESVGIVRSVEGLQKALKEITAIPARDYRIQHRQLVCYKMIEACLQRPKSLGCHYMTSEI